MSIKFLPSLLSLVAMFLINGIVVASDFNNKCTTYSNFFVKIAAARDSGMNQKELTNLAIQVNNEEKIKHNEKIAEANSYEKNLTDAIRIVYRLKDKSANDIGKMFLSMCKLDKHGNPYIEN